MAPQGDQNQVELVRKLSAELRRRAGEVDTIFDLLPIGIGIADDPDCRDIRVNKAFAEQLGISTADNASLSAPEAERPPFRLVKDGRELSADELPMQLAAREGREVRAFEVDVVRADGQRVSLYEYAAPLFDEHGAVRGALGVFMDITDRRRVEQEQRFLAEASRILASSLDYDATLAALARLAIPVFGEYCAIDVQQDDGTFRRVGIVVDSPEREALAERLRAYPPKLSVDSPAARAIRSGEVVVLHDVSDELLERSAQSPEHLGMLRAFAATSVMLVPLRARARTLGLLTVGSFTRRQYTERDMALALDVAGRAALALDNALLYRDAQDANRLKEDFLATLSHELRTPLNALLGWTQLLRSAQLDDAARGRALVSIERNAQAQAVLINDLLDVSRVISGKLRLNQQPVDIAAVALAAADAVRPAVKARGVELNVALSATGSEVLGDADRLQQVVWNLLSNAVKFTPPGGRVALTVTAPAGAVQITVSDSGEGIEPALLPHVFERFRQGDSSTTRIHGGLGLGLAIVRHLIDLHGGAVTAASEGAGKGSRFTVTLPARAPTEGDPRERSEDTRLAGVRVLGVDTDEDSRELLLHALRRAGAEVMVVGSVGSAIEALGTFGPHVLVTGLDMPREKVPVLLDAVQHRNGMAPPVIALSAFDNADRTGAGAGAIATHLHKPVELDTLVNAILDLTRSGDRR